MRILFSLLATGLLSLSLFSCTNEPTAASAAKTAAPPAAPSSRLPEAATTGLTGVMEQYYELKNALVKSDTARTSAAASKLMAAAEDLNNNLGEGEGAKEMHNHLQTLMQQSETLINTEDPSSEKQRIVFHDLTITLSQALAQSGYKSGAVYQQYCPMAFDDKGAIWFSASAEIENPYLPKKMLHCGEVQDTL